MTLNDSNVSLDVQLYLSRNANARAGRGSGAEARMIDDDHLRGFTYSSDSRAGRSASRGRAVGWDRPANCELWAWAPPPALG